jgi:hypothetical protein
MVGPGAQIDVEKRAFCQRIDGLRARVPPDVDDGLLNEE